LTLKPWNHIRLNPRKELLSKYIIEKWAPSFAKEVIPRSITESEIDSCFNVAELWSPRLKLSFTPSIIICVEYTKIRSALAKSLLLTEIVDRVRISEYIVVLATM